MFKILLIIILNCFTFFIKANNNRIQNNFQFLHKNFKDDKENRTSVLILDLDGTLYDNECLIETEIRNNYRIFAKEKYNVSIEQCTEMRIKYGSTVRGLSLLKNSRDVFIDYYNNVYPRLDMSRLQKYSQHSKSSTGYSHHRNMHRAHQALYKITNTPIVIASNSPVFHVKRVLTRIGLANLNIAAYFTPERLNGVMKTEKEFWDQVIKLYPKETYVCTLIDDNEENINLVRKLGMRGLHIREDAGVTFTDCLVEYLTNLSESDKSNYQFEANRYLLAKNEIDAQSLNKDVFRNLQKHLANHVQYRQHIIKDIHHTSESDINKLNVLDLGCGHLNMFPKIVELIKAMNQEKIDPSNIKKLYYIAIESNLELYQYAANTLISIGLKEQSRAATSTEYERSFYNTISGIQIEVKLRSFNFMSEEGIKQIHALLLSSEQQDNHDGFDLILGACVADLYEPMQFSNAILQLARDQGGVLYLPITFDGGTQLYVTSTNNKKNIESTKPSWWSFSNTVKEQEETEKKRRSNGLPKLQSNKDCTNQPGVDTLSLDQEGTIDVVFEAYHNHLKSIGHHLSVSNLTHALEKHGCKKLLIGTKDENTSSDWYISKKKHPYMWRTMLHFILHGTCFELFDKVNLQQWVKDLYDCKDDLCFVVNNKDLLFELPKIERYIHHSHNVITAADHSANATTNHSLSYRFCNASISQLITSPPYYYVEKHSCSDDIEHKKDCTSNKSSVMVSSKRKSVEFIGPELVHVVEEDIPTILPETSLRIKTICTLISTGTELKVFKGELQSNDNDDDEPMDLTIKGLNSSSMRYPLRYGYSLVGIVEAVGSNLDDKEWLGQRVFAFCPHTTLAIVDVSCVQKIPLGISFEDAVFLPSVETAVSMVMDAQPMIGERVGIVGQGLIGQIISSIIKSSMPNIDLTVLDISDTKLKISQEFVGELKILNPLKERITKKSQFYDVCIEVSGSMAGLQTAVDNTIAGGRVVIGSWYNTAVTAKSKALKLGTRFHRSGIQLLASQVSVIPARFSNRWDKERRFDLTWKYLSKIRPSKLLLLASTANNPYSSIANLSDSNSVLVTYQSLLKGRLMTALLRNNE